jgi:hypothetical protein
MGLFGKKVSPKAEAIGELMKMDDTTIQKLMKQHKVGGFKNVKDLRKAVATGRKGLDGEKGMGALLAGLKGGGTGGSNYKNQPVSDRVHPSRHRAAWADEVRAAVKSGDVAYQRRLRSEGQNHGFL